VQAGINGRIWARATTGKYEWVQTGAGEQEWAQTSDGEHERAQKRANESREHERVPATMNECKYESRWMQMSVEVHKQEQMGWWARRMHTDGKKSLLVQCIDKCKWGKKRMLTYQCPLLLLAEFILASTAISLRGLLRPAQGENGILQRLLIFSRSQSLFFQRA